MWKIPVTRAFRAALFLCLALGFGQPAHADPQAHITGVRLGDHPDATRFVLDLSESVDFRVFVLADPYRVVIDLPEVAWDAPPPKEGQSVGLIKGFRYGLFSPGTFRVVLDTGGPIKIKQAKLLEPQEGYGPRLVLDLAPETREAFLAEAKKTALETAAAPKAQTPQPQAQPHPAKKTVVLDPGHGGVDPGAQGRSGVYEKFLTLSMALELKRQLEASGRFHVVLTRDRDIFIPLRERIAIARAAGADLFVSLHADTIDDPSIRGLSVYTLSETASDKEAAALAVSENKADVIAGVDLTNESPEVTNILIDLAQRETMNLSANFAEFAVAELARETRLLAKTHRFAGFAVLKAPDVPSVLVELGYLSHGREERQLRDPSYRARLASALAKGVERYFSWKDGFTKS
jgi:N-acetylmuramoyl-L-alanine amidase